MTAKAPGAGEAWGKRNGSEPLTVKSTKLVSGFVSTSSRVSGGGHFVSRSKLGWGWFVNLSMGFPRSTLKVLS